MRLPGGVMGWLMISLTGCAALDPDINAAHLAAPAGLQREQILTKPFVLTSWWHLRQPDAPVHIYIEGDGQAWLSRTEPSLNPTPRHALGLALAAADPAPNVVYLARPCQFTPMQLNPLCEVRWWTTQRYAPTVVAALNQAIDQFAARVPGQQLALIGYSGGGGLAVLLAAQRHDVLSLRTVAGNLDDEYINQLHHVTAMPQSLNAIDQAQPVAAIPQIHFSGVADQVVPPAVAQRFVQATGARCARAVTVPGLGHESDWAAIWPQLLQQTPACAPVNR